MKDLQINKNADTVCINCRQNCKAKNIMPQNVMPYNLKETKCKI